MKGILNSLDTAIDYLMSADLSNLVMGRNDVDGDEVFINPFSNAVELQKTESDRENYALGHREV